MYARGCERYDFELKSRSKQMMKIFVTGLKPGLAIKKRRKETSNRSQSKTNACGGEKNSYAGWRRSKRC